MKKYFLLAMAVMLFAGCVMAGPDKPITIKQLPKTAQDFIQKHFSNLVFANGEQDNDRTVEYTIKFTDGTELEFNQKGEWTDVDCNRNKVPDAIIPAQIRNYVSGNYQNSIIVKIQKENFGYEVELNNGLELKFNKEGKFISVDD